MRWTTKKTPADKDRLRAAAERRRKRVAPTRDEIRGDVDAYCDSEGLTERARATIKVLCRGGKGGKAQPDPRDLRGVPKEDRVPRSLEAPPTPPGYWLLDTPMQSKHRK